MTKEIVIGVVTSLLGAFLMYFFLGTQNLLTKEITDSQLVELAKKIVNDEPLRVSLINRLSEDERFKGDKGDQGETGTKGQTGEVGPEWEPALTYFKAHATTADSNDKLTTIGSKKYCGLTSAGGAHANQACWCILQHGNEGWSLKAEVDEREAGSCYCAATCMD